MFDKADAANVKNVDSNYATAWRKVAQMLRRQTIYTYILYIIYTFIHIYM